MCKINGVKLTEMRKKAGMSQKTLAKQIGVAESTISNYETGRTDPTDVTLRKMSVIFKVDPKDLEIDEKVLLAKAIINGKRDLRNVKSKELTPMETQELFEKLRNYNEKFAEEEVEKAKTAYQNFFGKSQNTTTKTSMILLRFIFTMENSILPMVHIVQFHSLLLERNLFLLKFSRTCQKKLRLIRFWNSHLEERK